MSVNITTYTGLAAATSEWLARAGDTDIAARFDDILALTEQRMYYGAAEVPGLMPECPALRIREMETTDSAFALSSATVAQPTGFLELIEASLNGSQQGPLDVVTEGVFASYGSQSLGGVKLIAISGTNFRLKDTPSSDTAYLRYFQKLTTPTASTANDILTKFPSLYLNGCIAQAALYVGDDGAAQRFGAMYVSEVAGLNRQRNSELWSATNVHVRIRGRTP